MEVKVKVQTKVKVATWLHSTPINSLFTPVTSKITPRKNVRP